MVLFGLQAGRRNDAHQGTPYANRYCSREGRVVLRRYGEEAEEVGIVTNGSFKTSSEERHAPGDDACLPVGPAVVVGTCAGQSCVEGPLRAEPDSYRNGQALGAAPLSSINVSDIHPPKIWRDSLDSCWRDRSLFGLMGCTGY